MNFFAFREKNIIIWIDEDSEKGASDFIYQSNFKNS